MKKFGGQGYGGSIGGVGAGIIAPGMFPRFNIFRSLWTCPPGSITIKFLGSADVLPLLIFIPEWLCGRFKF